MRFLDWIMPEPISDIQRALSLLDRHKTCHTVGTVTRHDHFMVGTFHKRWFKDKPDFHHVNLKFSKNGESAMISSNGTVDFFFSTKEEVDKLKGFLTEKFGVVYE